MSTPRTLEEHMGVLRELPAGTRRIAFFDLDRTLVAGYTMAALVFEQARRGLLSPRQLARQSLNYVQYGRARIGFDRLIGEASADFAGATLADAESFAESVCERHVEPYIYREARRLIAQHQRLGHEIVMVTSATQFQAEPVARRLGIDTVCCTQLEVKCGTLTGAIAGKPCFGRGKATAGRRIAQRLGVDLEHSFFYTESLDDLPLLDLVGFPVAVNAQAELAARAAHEGWPELRFSSRALPSLQGALRTGLACNALLAAAAAGGVAWLGTRSSRHARNSMMSALGDFGTGLAGLDIEVAGRDHLERVRPAVFIFNHQSMLDAVVLAQLVRHDLVAFCKQELATNPVLGPLMRASGAIFVDRGNGEAARGPLRLGMAALRDGHSIAVAPEGTRGNGEDVAPFRHGAFVLAHKAGVPVVPVVLHNCGDAMPRGSLLLRPLQLRVTVLPPLDVSGWKAREFGPRVTQVEDQYRAVLAG